MGKTPVSVNRESKMWWIRRHRILALLAPFAAMVVIIVGWVAISLVIFRDEIIEPPVEAFLSGVEFGLCGAARGLIDFAYSPVRIMAFRWLAWPFYLAPASVFLASEKAVSLISAYVLYFVLACFGVVAGYYHFVGQME